MNRNLSSMTRCPLMIRYPKISQVGLTSKSLRLHNKRLRGHGWTADEQPKSPPRTRQRTEMKPPATPPKREGRPQAAGSTAAVVTGPPKGWQQPPPLPPPTTRPPPDTPKTRASNQAPSITQVFRVFTQGVCIQPGSLQDLLTGASARHWSRHFYRGPLPKRAL